LIEPLTRTDFPSWKSDLMIVLSLTNIYRLCARVEETKAPAAKTEGYEALRAEYLANTKKREWSNHLFHRIMKNSISESIMGEITNNENAKKYLTSMEDHYKGTSEFYAVTLMLGLQNTLYTVKGVIIIKNTNIKSSKLFNGLVLTIPNILREASHHTLFHQSS